MKSYPQKVKEAVDLLKKHITIPPDIGIMTGTGLGESLESLQITATLDYGQIPNMPQSTVQSHHGRLVIGTIGGRGVIAMQGRFHLYEGYSPLEVTFPIRVMQAMGVHTVILTNAAGGLNLSFKAGDIMVIADHINLTNENPLVGINEDSWGTRFPDMTSVYDPHLVKLVEKAAKAHDISMRKGIYVGLKGPSLETSAETRFLRLIGGDAVGFSTVQEAIAAVHGGMKIMGLSTITNINDPDNPVPDTEEAIIKVAQTASSKISAIIKSIVKDMAEK